jgi:hypothetical protein
MAKSPPGRMLKKVFFIGWAVGLGRLFHAAVYFLIIPVNKVGRLMPL